MDLPNYFNVVCYCISQIFFNITRWYWCTSPVEAKMLAHTGSKSEMQLFTQQYSKEFPRALDYFLDPAARGSSVEYL